MTTMPDLSPKISPDMNTPLFINEFLPPAENSPSNIMNKLSDNCLMDIFEFLDVEDLGSVAKTCERFNENVNRIASSRLKSETFICEFNAEESEKWSNYLLQFIHFSQRFAQKTTSIDLKFDFKFTEEKKFTKFHYFASLCQSSIITTLLTYYANADTLNKMKIFGMDVSTEWYFPLNQIFERLQHLELNRTSTGYLTVSCKNLINFKFINAGEELAAYIVYYLEHEHLQSLETDYLLSTIRANALREFLGRLGQLKKLNLRCSYDPKDLNSIINTIANNGSLIEQLNIQSWKSIDNDVVINILHLQQLKKLEIIRCEEVNYIHLIKFLCYLPNLKELIIHIDALLMFGLFNGSIQRLSRRYLHVLKLCVKKDCHLDEARMKDFLSFWQALKGFDETSQIMMISNVHQILIIRSKHFVKDVKFTVDENVMSDDLSKLK